MRWSWTVRQAEVLPIGSPLPRKGKHLRDAEWENGRHRGFTSLRFNLGAHMTAVTVYAFIEEGARQRLC